jgi:hypothetical protein
MQIEKWLYDELSEDQRSRIKEAVVDRIVQQIGELSLVSKETFSNAIESAAANLDYRDLESPISDLISRSLGKLKPSDIKGVAEAVSEHAANLIESAMDDIDYAEIQEVINRKVVEALK